MAAFSPNGLIVAAVVCLAAGVIGWQKFAAPIPAPSVVVKKAGPGYDTCYKEGADRRLRGANTDEDKVSQAWHRQVVRLLGSVQPDPEGIPADIRALPDFHGTEKLQNLHAVMARERQEGGSALFQAVQKFSAYKLDDVLKPDNSVREQVRQILFLWMGVERVDPASRGMFIDARELKFFEKLSGEAFFQIGRYLNPTTVSAQLVRENFNRLVDHYYQRLIWRVASRQLFIKTRTSGERNVMLNDVTLDYLAAKAAAMKPAERIVYWRNLVIAMSDYNNDKYTVSDVNTRLLEPAIQASGSALADVMESLRRRRVKMWWDASGRAMRIHITYSDDMNFRQVCYSWDASGIPSAIVRTLP